MNLNFGKNPGAKFLNQLYIRQALEYGHQPAGDHQERAQELRQATWSELPPSTRPRSPAAITQPYPFSLTKAAALLKESRLDEVGSRRWSARSPVPVATDCGAGIAAGDR
jgi:hypothetical protein